MIRQVEVKVEVKEHGKTKPGDVVKIQ